jgi:type IV pilus assembly protein PilQ
LVALAVAGWLCLPLAAQQTQGGSTAQAQGQEGDLGAAGQGDAQARLTLKLKDRDLGDIVASIRRKTNANIILDPGITETVTIELQDVHWRQALDLVAAQAHCIVRELDGGVLKIEQPQPVFFAFENTDIQKVVDTIGKISGANIVVSPEVQGQITVRLKDVPWRHALDACVKTLGFVVVDDNGILRVMPPSNIELDLVSERFPLRYVRPQSIYVPFIESEYIKNERAQVQYSKGEINFTLLEALRAMITPEIGRLDYIAESNVLIIRDTRPVVDAIRKTIEIIDVEPAQIFLDVRFVTTSNEDILDIGVNPGGGGWSPSIGLGAIPHRLPFDMGAKGWEDDIIASDADTGPFATTGQGGLSSANLTIPDVVFGALDFTTVSMTLKMLQKDASTEIVQSPRITALDHRTATIFVGEAVRYAQARVEQGQAGGLLLALEEGDQSPVSVGFQLLATPHIVPGTDKVILEIIPKRTALSGTGSTTLAPAGFDVFTIGTSSSEEGRIALPRVSSSTLATTVLLSSGQSAVLGGLKSKTETESTTQLPYLGDIPILGHLFKNKTRQEVTTTLLVFVTPSIIRSSEETQERVNRMLEERTRDHRSPLTADKNEIFGQNK